MSLLDLDIPSGSHQEDAFIAAFDEYNDALFRHAFFRLSDRDESDERYMTELHDHSHETLITSIDARHALEYLQDIPPQYREAVVLRYIDGLSPKEIAELIETTENVVSLRIHRGLKALKKILETKQ